MWFARISFECADGWTAIDMNQSGAITASNENAQLFSGSMALLQPQAIRQYIYVLSPTAIPTFPVPPQPGSSIPLGRLDISWRSQFGEPGRLLTSVRESNMFSIPCLYYSVDALSSGSRTATATLIGDPAASFRYTSLLTAWRYAILEPSSPLGTTPSITTNVTISSTPQTKLAFPQPTHTHSPGSVSSRINFLPPTSGKATHCP